MNNGEKSYNLEIYTIKAIKTAIRYYSAICRIDYRVNGNYALCSFCAKEEYIEQIQLEFDNFLIELMQHEDVKHDVIS